MLRLAADADLDGRLVRGLLRREPTIDIVRVQDVGMRTASDPEILAWAASERPHRRDARQGHHAFPRL